MKRILYLLALLIICFNSFGQGDVRASNGVFDHSLRIPLDTFSNLPNGSVAYKSGTMYYKFVNWIALGAATSTFGGNIGSGYRVYLPASNANKSIFGGYGITWDSSSNSNALTSKLDSATAFAQIRGTVKWPLYVITSQFGNSTDTILYNPLSDHGFALALAAFGDSFTNPGSNASTDSAYIDRLAYFLGLTLNNYAVAGRGVAIAVANHNLNINPGMAIFSSIMSGFNDLRRTNAADPITYRKTLNKIINAYKAMFVNQYLKVFYEAGSGSVTRYGAGWSTGYQPQLVNGKSGTGAITTALNDSVNYIFTGETNVVATLIGCDSVNQAGAQGEAILYEPSTGTVIKDTTFTLNNQWDGISDGTNNNQRGPYALVFHDLSKTKTYKLKLICKQAGNQFAVDYVGHLVDPTAGMQMIVFDPAYMDATGYATSPAGASDPVMDEGKRVIDSTINSIKRTYPVYIANTNSQYVATTSSGLSGDHIHPNNTGHRQIFQTATAVLPAIVTLPRPGSLFNIGGNLYVSCNGVPQQLNGYVNSATGIHEVNTGTFRSFAVELAEGKAGGGTAIGGKNSGDNLNLKSTSHATLGSVNIDATASFEGVNKRSSLGGTTTSDAMLFIRHAGINLSDKNIKLQSATSQTGDVIHWIDASNNVKLRWMVGGGVMFGTGPFDGNYPAAGTYLGINGGVHQYRNVSSAGTSWEPVEFEASTLALRTGTSSLATAFSIDASGVVNLPLLTASRILALDGSKNVISTATTGSGNVVLGTSPALTTPSFSGTPTGTITSGTTTPTMTSVANVASSGTPVLFYQRIGDYVYGTIVLTVTPTAGAVSTQIDFSLPIASNFALTTDLIGSGTTVGATFEPALLFADFTNDRGHIEFTSTSTSTHTVSVTFQYKII